MRTDGLDISPKYVQNHVDNLYRIIEDQQKLIELLNETIDAHIKTIKMQTASMDRMREMFNKGWTVK